MIWAGLGVWWLGRVSYSLDLNSCWFFDSVSDVRNKENHSKILTKILHVSQIMYPRMIYSRTHDHRTAGCCIYEMAYLKPAFKAFVSCCVIETYPS